ncbi:hypothetical protein AAFF_G00095560 [Aldrovandia affinis]|uniref:Uncharacterized protein n=1 Tax=Aldrovandia affinis TaxID=143900 RepID=A0AAD7RVN3_9TELE|nr:hypothetical protein AAFF_G00095560 [Aldrovandia affinis]
MPGRRLKLRPVRWRGRRCLRRSCLWTRRSNGRPAALRCGDCDSLHRLCQCVKPRGPHPPGQRLRTASGEAWQASSRAGAQAADCVGQKQRSADMKADSDFIFNRRYEPNARARLGIRRKFETFASAPAGAGRPEAERRVRTGRNPARNEGRRRRTGPLLLRGGQARGPRCGPPRCKSMLLSGRKPRSTKTRIVRARHGFLWDGKR